MPYQYHEHPDYLEIRFEGPLRTVAPIEHPPLEGEKHGRVLVDCSGVTELAIDVMHLASRFQRAESLGYRVAVFAPRPAIYGLTRQAFQFGHVREGLSAAVFSDQESAQVWLRTG